MMMGMRIIASIVLCLILTGCTAVTVDLETRKATLFRLLTDTQIESFNYTKPDGSVLTIGGYSSVNKVESAIKLLEAVK